MSDLERRAGSMRQNNIGLLRLLLSALVIVSHVPEIMYGNRSHELLTQAFGTLSFGEVAVDGFFVISGYLITASLQRHRTVPFIVNRALRIYPGYVVAFIICVFVIAPATGGSLRALSTRELVLQPYHMLRLMMPKVPGSFSGLPDPLLNGAMWTIAYEFRCYVLALLLGLFGLYRGWRRWAYVAVAFAAGAFGLWYGERPLPVPLPIEALFGSIPTLARLFAIFAVGAMHYMFRSMFTYRGRMTALCGIAVALAMFHHTLAEPVLVLLGSYMLFWFGFAVRPTRLAIAALKTDVSYGLYLYGWPSMMLLLWIWPASPCSVATVITLVVAALAGFASWHLVEKPSMQLKDRWRLDPRAGR